MKTKILRNIFISVNLLFALTRLLVAGTSDGRGFVGVGDALPATVIVVSNTNDSGPGSLRDALAAANDGDTIDATGVSGTILLTGGELQINHNVTINGPGAEDLAVNGNATSRVFENFASDATISGLTITNGLATFRLLAYFGGGGILNHGGLTLSGTSILSNNVNSGGFFVAFGGGIYVDSGGTLTVTNSTISGNQTGLGNGQGGGIAILSGGRLTVTNSVINNNQAGGPNGSEGFGGGICAQIATVTVSNTEINGNLGFQGGGIYLYAGSLTVMNSTISNNSAGAGGGINISDAGGTLMVTNSTISNNTASGFGLGGGVCNNLHAILTVTNSTISGNSAGTGWAIFNAGAATIGDTILNTGGTIYNAGTGTFTSLGYNLASDNGGGVLTGPGDQINTDPMLGPLQDNGGPTFTKALLPGSPAIDAGDPSFTPPPFVDQRGPGFRRVRHGRIDIGSFEVQRRP